ncbi:hypothetical protein ACXYMZ_14975 [Oceanobacillus sp. CAU 1775]
MDKDLFINIIDIKKYVGVNSIGDLREFTYFNSDTDFVLEGNTSILKDEVRS